MTIIQRLVLLCLCAAFVFLDALIKLNMLVSIIWGTGRAWQIALGYDRICNACLGNSSRETISSRLGRVGPRWAEVAVDWIFERVTGEKNHCKNNIEPGR